MSEQRQSNFLVSDLYGKETLSAEAIAQRRIGYGAQGAIYESDEHWEQQLRIWDEAHRAAQPPGDVT